MCNYCSGVLSGVDVQVWAHITCGCFKAYHLRCTGLATVERDVPHIKDFTSVSTTSTTYGPARLLPTAVSWTAAGAVDDLGGLASREQQDAITLYWAS